MFRFVRCGAEPSERVCARARAFNLCFTAVLRVAEKRFTADAVAWYNSKEWRKGGERRGGHGPEDCAVR